MEAPAGLKPASPPGLSRPEAGLQSAEPERHDREYR
jgi:hypothetical protein